MTENEAVKYYPPAEEKINILSHAIGLCLSILALVMLLHHAWLNGSALHLAGFGIFGLSLIALYAASTHYHRAKDPTLRRRSRVFDHASIYLLIAGTYTPFSLLILSGHTGWLVFSLAWSLAFLGVTLKLFYTGKYTLVSTMMYVLMGWMVVFFIEPLAQSLSSNGLQWLLAGGIAYTLGAVLYAIKVIPFNHAIFHIFVLAGSGCHFVSVYFYILPHP